MEQVQELMQDVGQYTESNCFLFVIICHAMEDGYLMDRYQEKTFQLNELAEKICVLSSLEGKPKMILTEEYSSGRSNYFISSAITTSFSCPIIYTNTIHTILFIDT